MNVEIFKLEIQKKITEAGKGSADLVSKVKEEVEKIIHEIIDFSFGKFEELAEQIKLLAQDELA